MKFSKYVPWILAALLVVFLLSLRWSCKPAPVVRPDTTDLYSTLRQRYEKEKEPLIAYAKRKSDSLAIMSAYVVKLEQRIAAAESQQQKAKVRAVTWKEQYRDASSANDTAGVFTSCDSLATSFQAYALETDSLLQKLDSALVFEKNRVELLESINYRQRQRISIDSSLLRICAAKEKSDSAYARALERRIKKKNNFWSKLADIGTHVAAALGGVFIGKTL